MINGFVACVVLYAVLSLAVARPLFHLHQQNGYKLKKNLLQSKLFKGRYITLFAISLSFLAAWAGIYFASNRELLGIVLLSVFVVASAVVTMLTWRSDVKKKLVYTKRIKRLAVMFSALVLCVEVGGYFAFRQVTGDMYAAFAVFYVLQIFLPFMFMLAHFAILPLEKLIYFHYKVKTSAKLSGGMCKKGKRIGYSGGHNKGKTLENTDDCLGVGDAIKKSLIKIGITGSYGKTSVKNFLATMLEKKYSVLMTEGSFNTPMGISKTVQMLDCGHEVFIAEMGARNVGDIKELGKMVAPQYGIITAVAPQHIETFKSIENVLATKLELADTLQDGGTLVLGGDCKILTGGFDARRDAGDKHYEGLKVISAGLCDICDVSAKDIEVSEKGSNFTLVFSNQTQDAGSDKKKDTTEIAVETKILGRHNIQNIVLASALAYELGVSADGITQAISELKPVPHRLELFDGGGITIVDDSFNSNISGAKAAVELIALFEGRKVILTPGMVELGEIEYEANRGFGRQIAAVFDVCMLVGEKRTMPIKEGLLSAGFKGEVLVYESLQQAQNDFGNVLRFGDVLLIENDLPDNL